MRQNLSSVFGHRITEFPAAVVRDLKVAHPLGPAHRCVWEAVIDTGADLTIFPEELVQELKLPILRNRVRVWTYRRDDPPHFAAVYFAELEFPGGLIVPTKAITSNRKNILIGRSALQQMRLIIDWPSNTWSLENATLPEVPRTP